MFLWCRLPEGLDAADIARRALADNVVLAPGNAFSLSQTAAGFMRFNVAGPKARQLLQGLTDADLATTAFPFMRSRRIKVGGIKVIALRVSFTGDLGWELHCAEGDQSALYEALIIEARKLGGGPVGSRALTALRVEKGYGSWGREYSTEYWPQEVRMERLVKMDKGDFLNRDAYAAIADRPARDTLVMLAIETDDADATGGEPIFLTDGTPAGQVTSGAYGYSVGMSLALATLKAGLAKPGDTVSVAILGRPHKARVLEQPPFDPKGTKLRA
jgi:dimethylglycine dehydrogenase